MVYIKVEMWPGGNQKEARTLGEALITNVGGTDTYGDYTYTLSKFGGFETGLMSKVASVKTTWKKGKIFQFRRKTRGPWDLILTVLKDAIADRQG